MKNEEEYLKEISKALSSTSSKAKFFTDIKIYNIINTKKMPKNHIFKNTLEKEIEK